MSKDLEVVRVTKIGNDAKKWGIREGMKLKRFKGSFEYGFDRPAFIRPTERKPILFATRIFDKETDPFFCTENRQKQSACASPIMNLWIDKFEENTIPILESL